MPGQMHVHKVEAPVSSDVPDTREYETEADAELDRAMVAAIDAAGDAGNDFLEKLLALELASHFYSTR